VSSAVVFVGGDAPSADVVSRLPADRFVIAADSGFDHALMLGIDVDLLVGDLDSISPDGLATALAKGVEVVRHRPDKDATDTELALDAAVARGCAHVVVVSGSGDRFDHELGALMTIARPALKGVSVEAWWGRAYLRVLHGPEEQTIAGRPDELVSLLPLHGDAHRIHTSGLRYALADETLWAGSSRGVSNEFLGSEAAVAVGEGTLLIVVPHALDRDADRLEGDHR